MTAAPREAEPAPAVASVGAPSGRGAADGPPPSPAGPLVAAVSGDAEVTQVALAVLEDGGSAADAAVAASLTSGVVQPVSSGLGGSGMALVWDASKKEAVVIDFRATAPIGLRPVDHRLAQPPANKPGAFVGVPGEVAGLCALHERWGRMPFAELTERAARVAEGGFAESEHMTRALRWNRESSRPVTLPWTTSEAEPTRVRNLPLAATLRTLGREGRDAFYRGALGLEVVTVARQHGSRMVGADLAGYRAIERRPLAMTWGEYEVLTVPPPSGGGLLLLQTLAMHSHADLEALQYPSGQYVHAIAEGFRGALTDRARFVGDPAFVNIDLANLLSASRLAERKRAIDPRRTTRVAELLVEDGGTAHVLTADDVGNVVALSTTVGHMFGAKLATASGFLLNDELGDFTPIELMRRAGQGRPPNAPKGGARPVTSITPVIVRRGDALALAAAASGGARIPTAVTEVLLHRLALGASAARAVALPRFDTPFNGGLLLDAGFPADLEADLRGRGEVVNVRPNFSAVGLLVGADGGSLEAAADPRKDERAAGVRAKSTPSRNQPAPAAVVVE